jgi:hypothetical protein
VVQEVGNLAARFDMWRRLPFKANWVEGAVRVTMGFLAIAAVRLRRFSPGQLTLVFSAVPLVAYRQDLSRK